MRKRKNSAAALALAAVLSLTSFADVFAVAYDFVDPVDYDAMTDFTIHMEVPEGFNERVEVYLDETPFFLYYIGDDRNNGYDMDTIILPGIYRVTVVSSTDAFDRYGYSYPATFDVENDKILNITAFENAEYGNDTYLENFGVDQETAKDLADLYAFLFYVRNDPAFDTNTTMSPQLRTQLYEIEKEAYDRRMQEAFPREEQNPGDIGQPEG